VWNEKLEFIVGYPELAFIRFVVWDSDPIGRDFIGQTTIPLQVLKSGLCITFGLPIYGK